MVVQPISRIESRRLDLVALTAADASEMVSVLADPALYTFTGGEPPVLSELAERYARQLHHASADGTETWWNWIVRMRPSGMAIGFVQATLTTATGVADIAWLIGVPWQGRGYGSEAANALVGWLERAGVNAITAHIRPNHEASARVATAAGLAPTGELGTDGEQIWRRPPPVASD